MKSYVICPYCKDEKTISGMTMHVKVKHPDKFTEFKTGFEELKKTKVIKDSGTRTPVKPGEEPPRIEDKPEDKVKDKPANKQVKTRDTPEDKHPSRGDDKPAQGKSFLRDFDEWVDSDQF
jgi:hypothetical protein